MMRVIAKRNAMRALRAMFPACKLTSVINVHLLISERSALNAGRRNAEEPFTLKDKMDGLLSP